MHLQRWFCVWILVKDTMLFSVNKDYWFLMWQHIRATLNHAIKNSFTCPRYLSFLSFLIQFFGKCKKIHSNLPIFLCLLIGCYFLDLLKRYFNKDTILYTVITSKMEFLGKMVKGFRLNIFVKGSILDVWQGSEYTSRMC